MPELGSRLYWPFLPTPSLSSAVLATLALLEGPAGAGNSTGLRWIGFDFGQLIDGDHRATGELAWPGRAQRQERHTSTRKGAAVSYIYTLE